MSKRTPQDPRVRLVLAVTGMAKHGTEALIALVDYAASVTATRTEDPAWGRVDGDHLPAWISAETFRDACAAGMIDGAVKVGRRWVAPRHTVEAWALAGAKTAPSDDETPEAAGLRAMNDSRKPVAPAKGAKKPA